MKPKNEKNKETPASGLRVAAPALLAGLGLMGAASPSLAQQGPAPISPVAVDDNYIGGLNGGVVVDPTNSFQRPLNSNDTSDPNNCNSVSIQILSLPTHGTLTLPGQANTASIGDEMFCTDTNTFGGFIYTPDLDWVGTDQFTYALVDSSIPDSSNAVVNITTSTLPFVGSLGAGMLAPLAALALLRRRKKDD